MADSEEPRKIVREVTDWGHEEAVLRLVAELVRQSEDLRHSTPYVDVDLERGLVTLDGRFYLDPLADAVIDAVLGFLLIPDSADYVKDLSEQIALDHVRNFVQAQAARMETS